MNKNPNDFLVIKDNNCICHEIPHFIIQNYREGEAKILGEWWEIVCDCKQLNDFTVHEDDPENGVVGHVVCNNCGRTYNPKDLK